MAVPNKVHWYDGWFYEKFIAPNQDTLFARIRALLPPDAAIIDVGCGTGRFSFSVGSHCASVLGIDLSRRNIDRALMTLARRPNEKLSFLHAAVEDIAAGGHRHFDCAVMTYVIHEIDEEERVPVLRAMAAIADTVIIGDYLVPKPAGLSSRLNDIVEFAAGADHYSNYTNYVANGGIHGLAVKAGLEVVHEVRNSPATGHIVLARHNNSSYIS